MVDGPATVRCLFVHGWGMNHTVWQPVIEQLPDWVESISVDLPGHGSRSAESFSDLQGLTRDLQRSIESNKKSGQLLIVVAWSLGALPCLDLLASEFNAADGLMVVSSNPCFVTRENWSYGIKAEVFDQFAESLKADFSGTIRRFLSLQVKGSETGREILRSLRQKILQQPEPDASSLDAGLEILKSVDLREQLQKIKQPVCWALGAQDGLVKAELTDALDDLMSNSDVKVYNKSGHAPFLSNTDEFIQQLVNFSSGIAVKINEQ